MTERTAGSADSSPGDSGAGGSEVADSGVGDSPEDFSWAVGPADYRGIRVLLYLAEGLLGGAALSALFVAIRNFRPAPNEGGPWLSGVVAVFVLLVLGRVVWFYAIVRVAAEQSHKSEQARKSEGSRGSGLSTLFRNSATAEWMADQQWRWPVAATIVVAAGLVALGGEAEPTPFEDPLWYAALLVAVGFSALAELLSSEGCIDADALTLSTVRYRETREVDLRTLTSVRRVSVGPFTILWLSVAPGVERRTAVQGFYAMPNRVVEQVWSAFEEGLAADPPIDPDTAERARFFRRVNRVVAVGVLVVGIGFLVLLAWVGGSVWNLFVVAWLLVGGGLFFLKLAA